MTSRRRPATPNLRGWLIVVACLVALGAELFASNAYRVDIVLALVDPVGASTQVFRTLYVVECLTLVAGTIAVFFATWVPRASTRIIAGLTTLPLFGAIGLNPPHRYNRGYYERGFVEEFSTRTGSPEFATAVFDATLAATVTLIVLGVASLLWMIVLTSIRDPKWPTGAVAVVIAWAYPVVALTVIVLVALGGAPAP